MVATFTKRDLIENATKHMENCMAYLTIGDKKMAAINYGAASVYEELLNDVFDVFLDDEEEGDEHYRNMLEIWWNNSNF